VKLFEEWDSEDYEKAEEAVKKIIDQKELAQTAVKARLWTARKLAVEKLIAAEHQPLLAKIALTDRSPNVRKAAVKQLRDQACIADVAGKAKNPNVRQAAIEKLKDSACIVELARNANRREARIAAIALLIAADHQPLLAEIAKTDEAKDVRNAAIDKLRDQACIADVVRNAKYHNARIAAIEKLRAEEYQPLLAEIAKTYKHRQTRIAAIEQLRADQYQPLLANIVKKDKDRQVRIAAIEQLSAEHPLLAEIAKTDKDDDVRIAAIEQLSRYDPVLAEIAKKDEWWRVRIAAIARLSPYDNESLLAEIATTDIDSDVRKAAIKNGMLDRTLLIKIMQTDCAVCDAAFEEIRMRRPNDQPTLAELAKADVNKCYKLIAILAKLTDQAYIADVARNAKIGSIREVAIERLIAADHQPLLAEIAWKDKDYDVCKAAIDKLTDKQMLKQIIAHHGDRLQNSESENILLHIYNKHDDAELRKQIASYNGTVIQEYAPKSAVAPERPERRFHVPEP
jgi:thiol-disulfide isomerase/thioredoxin